MQDGIRRYCEMMTGSSETSMGGSFWAWRDGGRRVVVSMLYVRGVGGVLVKRSFAWFHGKIVKDVETAVTDDCKWLKEKWGEKLARSRFCYAYREKGRRGKS